MTTPATAPMTAITEPEPMISPEEFKRIAKRQARNALETQFLIAWTLRHSPPLPRPERQWKFHKFRRWRFDFAWPRWNVAVEIQGGSFTGGGHNRGAQQAKDYEKQREAVRLGWRVLPFNTKDMDDINAVVDFVAEVLTKAKG